MSRLIDEFHGYIAELLELVNHRWDDTIDDSSKDRDAENHGDDDGNGAYPDVQFVLHEFDNRIKQVGE